MAQRHPACGPNPYFMDNVTARYGKDSTAQDQAAAKLVSGYLVNFVKTGNPNGGTLPQWPPLSGGGRTVADL